MLSDKLKRRKLFIILGGVIVASLWLPMIFVANATELIILLTLQALLGSMATPAWAALIGDIVPSLRLGRVNATINLWTTAGSLAATLISGVVMSVRAAQLREMFFIPLLAASFCSFISTIIMLKINESESCGKVNAKENYRRDVFEVFNCAKESSAFIRYCYVEGTFHFFMSIAWPLMAITQIRVLGTTMLDIATFTVAQSIMAIVFQGWAGSLADRIGRKPLLVFSRISLLTVPVAYAFSPDMRTLIAAGALWGISNAVGQTSMTAYLLDVAPSEYRGSFAAMFNFVVGAVSFTGSLIGGYFSDHMISMFGLILGLQIVYMVSFVGRVLSATLYFTLQETLKRQN